MATKVRRVLIAFLLSILFIQPVDAFAYGQAREATVWGHIYAAPASGKISTQSRPAPKRIEKKSTFLVKYTGFPKWAEAEFQAAADVWAENYPSDVPINIDATWTRMTSPEILGTARPDQFHSGFTNAPDLSLWYATAMANAISGRDLNGRNPELIIQVNSTANWYQGGPTGTITTREYDLQSVFLHEMAHGLGFLANDEYDAFTGIGRIDQPTPFEAYALVEDKRRLADLPSPSIELGTALTSKLVWSGPLGVAANNGVMPLLFTPSRYLDGSSISHLDDATFSKTGPNSVMTPSLEGGEIFHEPGPLLLAMMKDMRNKPPAGIPFGIPLKVNAVSAIVSDASAIINFDPPSNARATQVSGYVVKNLRTGVSKTFTDSPALVTGLKNGTSYTFTVAAKNENGSSDPVVTNLVTPQAGWKKTTLDGNADAKSLTATVFNGKQTVVYTNSRNGSLNLATWSGTKWSKVVVDGVGGGAGRTTNPITGPVSVCVNGSGSKQTLNIFYTEKIDQYLRYAAYNGKSFSYEVVDGNAAVENSYKDPVRVRTDGNLSVSSACVADNRGVQVFYRDDSQGIVLGAFKPSDGIDWVYELVDGDKNTEGRSTGDVGFHLDAYSDGKKTWVIYDSMITPNSRNEAIEGAVRVAVRSGTDPLTWSYSNLDVTGLTRIVPGYDVNLKSTSKGVLATWMTTPVSGVPKPQLIKWGYVNTLDSFQAISPGKLGYPSKHINSDAKTTIFNCELRLCALDLTSKKISLVAKEQNPDGIETAWVVLNKVRYLVAGIKGQLTLLRP